jgi:hypothetical protein
MSAGILKAQRQYLMREDFRSGAQPAMWTDVNSPDFAYNANPLDGPYSLRLTSNGTWADFVMVSSLSEVWAFFKFRFTSAIGTQTNFFNFQTSGGVTQLQCNVTTGGAINLVHGSTSVTTSGTMTAGVNYNIWVHYKAGSGANGVGSVGFSATEEEATQGNNFASTTSGTSTGTIGLFDPENTNTGGGFDFIYGKARLDSQAIGSSPP